MICIITITRMGSDGIVKRIKSHIVRGAQIERSRTRGSLSQDLKLA